MKKIFVLALMLMFAFSLEAQVVRIYKPFFVSKQLARSAGDSSTTYINYDDLTAGRSDLFRGQVPDSIYIQYVASADSTAACKVVFQAKVSNGSSSRGASVVVDTIKQTTDAVGTQGYFRVPQIHTNGYDQVKIGLLNSNVAATPLNAATSSKLTVGLEFFFKVQAYKP